MLNLSTQRVLLIVGILVALGAAYLLGNSNARLKPLDESKWERALDSLNVLYQESLDQAKYWEDRNSKHLEKRDSLLKINEKLKLLNYQTSSDYAKVRDSINALSINQLQEYFSKRYPEE